MIRAKLNSSFNSIWNFLWHLILHCPDTPYILGCYILVSFALALAGGLLSFVLGELGFTGFKAFRPQWKQDFKTRAALDAKTCNTNYGSDAAMRYLYGSPKRTTILLGPVALKKGA